MTEQPCFIPLNQIASCIVKFEDAIPRTVDPARIGVNIGLIESMCKMYRIGELSVVGGHKVQRPGEDLFRTEQGRIRLPVDGIAISERLVLKITVNIAGLIDIVQSGDYPEGVRTPVPWVESFDEALKYFIADCGSKMLPWWDLKKRFQARRIIKKDRLLNVLY